MRRKMLAWALALCMMISLMPVALAGGNGSLEPPKVKFEVTHVPHSGSEHIDIVENGATVVWNPAEDIRLDIVPVIEHEDAGADKGDTFFWYRWQDSTGKRNSATEGKDGEDFEFGETINTLWINDVEHARTEANNEYYYIDIKGKTVSSAWGPSYDWDGNPVYASNGSEYHIHIEIQESKDNLEYVGASSYQYFVDNEPEKYGLSELYETSDELIGEYLEKTFGEETYIESDLYHFEYLSLTWTLAQGEEYSALPGETHTFVWTASQTEFEELDWTNSKSIPLSGELKITNPYAITFQGDGSTAVKYVAKNGTLLEKDFPAVPEKSGYVGMWEQTTDLEHVQANQTIQAVYTPILTVTPLELKFGISQEGYTQPEAKTVTIENIGKNRITVTLPVSEAYEIIGDDWENQRISLAQNEKATVEIRPVSGLSTGTYTEEITFSTDHPEVSATVKGIFEVEALPTYTISASPTKLDFGSAQEGYTQPVAQTVTITNDGNQDVTITLPTLTGYTITAGTGGWDTDNKVTFGPGDKVTFTVQPNTGLSVGNHNGTITVETGIGTSAEIKAAFTVTATSTPDPDPDPDPNPGTGTDDDNDYTLYYHSNFGKDKSFYQSEDDRRMEVRDYGDMSARLPDREGYVFTGWNTEPDGSGDDYAPGDIFRLKRSTDHLYAQWARAEDGVDTGVSRWLDTGDHRAYLSGYPDGAFGPDRSMTRAEVAQMFYGLLLDKDVDVTVSFTDVDGDAWYATAVNTLASLGLVSGVGNGQFAPQRAITRAEFATIAMGFARTEDGGVNRFSDVSRDDWFYGYVTGAAGYGWIDGYPDGTFRPNNTITRGEVTTIVNNMLARAADEDYVDDHMDDLQSFTDLSRRHWGFYQIMEATNSHDYRASGGVEQWRGLR